MAAFPKQERRHSCLSIICRKGLVKKNNTGDCVFYEEQPFDLEREKPKKSI
jgi:hypothetical protein